MNRLWCSYLNPQPQPNKLSVNRSRWLDHEEPSLYKGCRALNSIKIKIKVRKSISLSLCPKVPSPKTSKTNKVGLILCSKVLNICPDVGIKVIVQDGNQVDVQFLELFHSFNCVDVGKKLAGSDVFE